jgi:hypothetical protein
MIRVNSYTARRVKFMYPSPPTVRLNYRLGTTFTLTWLVAVLLRGTGPGRETRMPGRSFPRTSQLSTMRICAQVVDELESDFGVIRASAGAAAIDRDFLIDRVG